MHCAGESGVILKLKVKFSDNAEDGPWTFFIELKLISSCQKSFWH